MNRFMLPTAALLLLVTGAPAEAQKKVACPVIPSQMADVKDATAKRMFADYKGQRYYFCCMSCPEAFRKNPAKYAKKGVQTPKKKR